MRLFFKYALFTTSKLKLGKCLQFKGYEKLNFEIEIEILKKMKRYIKNQRTLY